MIDKKTYSKEWILDLKQKLGKKVDAKLIEKVVYALSLLEQLKVNGLDFIFKGGTALLLATKEPKRFSIDIDIIAEQSEVDIIAILDKIVAAGIFTRWQDDNKRKHTPDAPIGHFKMYYNSVIDSTYEEPILLDILYTPNPYPETMEIPIQHDWISTSGEIPAVTVPTFASILGDKLTAFAPKTTGILYSKNRSVEIVKQLYDIAFLFDNITDADLAIVLSSYAKVVAEEIGFRKLTIGADEVLTDTFEACYELALRNTASPEFEQLFLGIRNFTNFIISSFNIDEATVAAAKVAYLTELIKTNAKTIDRFNNPGQITHWMVENTDYNKLNKLKKNNPEAFYYWYKALAISNKL
ncbi:nucleotidyl transferase AbiEii/AbiGii toxin family protein [Flavobacterium terrisoli]|uniref:nucleotidyl transferase AbiEii/AbiGii toxin family protein n=1 Tax=Flavobacterium terrisoli TaxID=3242195 RepID=UPI002543C795|nr:nucleotidyl transferase AbiEii/AbiGii toxin family protein [Flavobacterium buctense]